MSNIIFVLSFLSIFICSDEYKQNKINHEIKIVYIGSSTCSFCTSIENKEIVNSIIEKIFSKSAFENQVLGIAIDKNIDEGVRFLSSLDITFDEIIVGGKSINSGYIKYVLTDFNGVEIIPHLLVLIIEYDSKNEIKIVNESLLYRIVGIDNLKKFESTIKHINFDSFIH